MYWVNFLSLHIAQEKRDDMVRRVIESAYRPLMQTLKAHSTCRTALSLDGALAQRLCATGGQDIIDDLRTLVASGSVELVGSAYANTILNLLPAEEIRPLIQRNDEVLRDLLGEVYRPRGFFPPEMAYSRTVAEVAQQLGFEWMLIDEMAHSGKPGAARNDCLYTLAGRPDFHIFFRDRSLSTGLSYGSFKTPASFAEALAAVSGQVGGGPFLITGNEAELYGYHRRGGERTLAELYAGNLPMCTLSDLLTLGLPEAPVEPRLSTWSQWEVLQF